MEYVKKFMQWLDSEWLLDEDKAELRIIKGNLKEIEDRFNKDLEFGTGGLRGLIGIGTNRMNIYTIRKATQGLANYINHILVHKPNSVVIAYDSRYKSDTFAEVAALVLNANGIPTYLYESLRPTPQLSYTVRELGAIAGIVITASHNPKEYNGFKVYWQDGGQITDRLAKSIIEEINEIQDFCFIKNISKEVAIESGLFNLIGSELDDLYIDKVVSVSLNPQLIVANQHNLKIIYTPLHGTGNKPVRRMLLKAGFQNVIVVNEQEHPDPEFTTVVYPNPEETAAFEIAIKYAKEHRADIILATDPDCDRVGVVVRNNNGEYIPLNGNQIGVLVAEYILSQMAEKKILPPNGAIIKTIVTTNMINLIAEQYNIETIDVLTGFKYIGEKIKEFEEKGDKQFIFGFEESYGALAGTFVRDKDAVIMSLLICETAIFHKSKGKSLLEAMEELYQRYGFFAEKLQNISLQGIKGQQKMLQALEEIRKNPPLKICDFDVAVLRDYQSGKEFNYLNQTTLDLNLPKSNVLHFSLHEGSWFCIRPSGTEPKMKIYYSVTSPQKDEVNLKLNRLYSHVSDFVYKLLS